MFVTFFVGKEKAKKRSRLWTGLRMTWTSSGRKMQSRQENSADSVQGKGRPPADGVPPISAGSAYAHPRPKPDFG